MTTSCGFCILLTTEGVLYIFPSFSVVPHLVVPAGWDSGLPMLAIFIEKYSIIRNIPLCVKSLVIAIRTEKLTCRFLKMF